MARNYRHESAHWRALFLGLRRAVLMEDDGLVTCMVCGADREPIPGVYPVVLHSEGCPVEGFDIEANP